MVQYPLDRKTFPELSEDNCKIPEYTIKLFNQKFIEINQDC